jgi:hypothetical protein
MRDGLSAGDAMQQLRDYGHAPWRMAPASCCEPAAVPSEVANLPDQLVLLRGCLS